MTKSDTPYLIRMHAPRPRDQDEKRSLNERLAGIFIEPRRRAQPTLPVFDTYEAAGEAKDWIESVLLPYLVPARWLRVVIAGQSVPARAGSTWESVAAGILSVIQNSPSSSLWPAATRARSRVLNKPHSLCSCRVQRTGLRMARQIAARP